MTRTQGRTICALIAFCLAFPLHTWAARAVVEWEYDYVNVRSSGTPSGEVTVRLAAGAEVEILEQRAEWTRVGYPGGEGWVVSRSLRSLPESVPPDPPSPPEPDSSGASSATTDTAAAGEPQTPTKGSASPDPEKVPRPGGYLSQYTETPEPAAFDTGPSMISAISGLLLVLALIAGCVLLVRKLLGSRFPAGRRPGGIRVLASRPVAPRQSLLLVEVEGLVWLVAQGPEGMRRIDRIDDPRALSRLDDRYEFLETPFQSELRRTLDLERGPGDRVVPSAGSGEEAPTREERLAALRRRGKPPADE